MQFQADTKIAENGKLSELQLRTFRLMAKTTASSATNLLTKKITHLLNASSERDMYPYMRDLLTTNSFGVGLKPEQIVVDSAISGTQDAPDLIVYTTKGGSHATGSFTLRFCAYTQSLRAKITAANQRAGLD